MLVQKGFQVDTHSDPVSALDSFKEGKCEIALLDSRMPKVTRFELFRKLSAIDPRVRFCFIGAFEIRDTEFATMFPDIKATKLLREPISISILLEVLKELMPERPPTPLE